MQLPYLFNTIPNRTPLLTPKISLIIFYELWVQRFFRNRCRKPAKTLKLPVVL